MRSEKSIEVDQSIYLVTELDVSESDREKLEQNTPVLLENNALVFGERPAASDKLLDRSTLEEVKSRLEQGQLTPDEITEQLKKLCSIIQV